MTDDEINSSVARKLGWTRCNDEDEGEIRWHTEKPFLEGMHGGQCVGELPDYCHSIKAAWEIVEFVAKEAERKGGGPLINICHDCQWHVSIGIVIVQADTAPMAMALCFLKLS